MLYSIMAVDVGVTSGYAVVRQDLFIEKVAQYEITPGNELMDILYSTAYKHKVDQVIIEYPVLSKKNSYYDKLKHAYACVDEFVMNIKEAQTWGMVVNEITPGQWKIDPVLNVDLIQFPQNGSFDVKHMSQHEKDALMICYYTFKWSL